MTFEEAARKAGSIGKPMLFAEACLRDSEGRDARSGQTVSSGYALHMFHKASGISQKLLRRGRITMAGCIPEIWHTAMPKASSTSTATAKICSSAAT
jgi:hypothetical protein